MDQATEISTSHHMYVCRNPMKLAGYSINNNIVISINISLAVLLVED